MRKTVIVSQLGEIQSEQKNHEYRQIDDRLGSKDRREKTILLLVLIQRNKKELLVV